MTNKTERHHTITLEQSQGNTLVVIDPRVEDYQMLARGRRPEVKILILDEEEDGVAQITRALATDPTGALHVVCHGAPGCLYLGKTPLNQENLSRYSQQLMEWGVAEISLYACNVAAEKNSEFLLRLHQLTGANIAASARRVGNAGKGGNWQLEYILGQMKSELAFLPAVVREYPGVFVSFDDAINFPVGGSPSEIAAGDIDGDGNLDLVTANGSRGFTVLLGNGNGGIAAALEFPADGSPASAALGDFNGDGNLDLVAANNDASNASNQVSVILGNGDGTFATATNVEPGNNNRFSSVATGDFNGDGNLDIIAAAGREAFNNISILLENGDGTFATPRVWGGGNRPVSLATGDFNGDGNLDIAAANGPSQVSVLFGNEDGDFNKITFGVGDQPNSVAVGDFNGDGNFDLVTANIRSDNVSVLLGNRNGLLSSATNFGVGDAAVDPWSVAVGDLDGDGNPDIATANRDSNNVSVLLGSGDGDFADAINFEAGNGPVSIAVVDFNKDSKLDLVVGDTGNSGNVSVLLNSTDRPAFIGTEDDDILIGTVDNEFIEGRGGDDQLLGKNGNDRLNGGSGNDNLNGGRGADTITGGDGNDLLIGGGENDLLNGELGRDILFGGGGSDTFVLSTEAAVDNPALADRILRFQSDVDAIGLTGGLTEGDLDLTLDGGNTVISIANSNQILGIVVGIEPAQVSGSFTSV
ncbi:MAG: FG-GAP-like repeat-containing protein [Hormoscilla sp.]